ncbi:unnamed protein product [Rotaria sordida]|uniref:Uncharacterized protein n=1 Tax=Rotaria sordida TaxID=392033 RepID=A0A818NJG8_9BILA|nr:unnamed protein product [Rotaria sordida]
MHFYETTEALPLLGSVPQALVDEEDKIISSTVENTQPALVDDESPYDIVAANVSNRDDPTLPCLTFRSCTLGLLFTCILAFVNQFFSFRTTPILLGMIVPQLLSYPMGKAMASLLPYRTVMLFGGRWKFSLNPGPFSIKEHCIISTMASTASVSLQIC